MTASEFVDNSHGSYPLLSVLLACGDKEGEEEWPVQDFMLEVFLTNNALTI